MSTDRRVRLTPAAAEQYRALDPTLQEEVRLQVEVVAEDPAALLAHAPHWLDPNGGHIHTYRSEVDPAMLFTLLFRGWNEEPQRLVLVAIGHARDVD